MTRRRLPFLLAGAIALLLGLDGGLALAELPAVPVGERLPDVHGFLLVIGFVGTLIALERAVALRRRVGFAAPALLGAGALLLVSPAPVAVGRALLVAGTAALALLYVPLWRRQRDDAVLVQALGAVAATGAAVLWLGGAPVPRTLPWLTTFVVLTIAGERLELARLHGGGRSRDAQLVAQGAAIMLGTVASLLWPAVGYPLLGLALLALVAWLAAHDVARRTIRSTGLPRFVAVSLVLGYGWLAAAGSLWLVVGPTVDGAAYDAAVHAVFLGFTMSMIMAHAPVILPAVLRVPLPYHPAMYGPLALLHASVALRLLVGDGHDVASARQLGSALNVLSVLAFVAVAAAVGIRSRRSRVPTPPGPPPSPGIQTRRTHAANGGAAKQLEEVAR